MRKEIKRSGAIYLKSAVYSFGLLLVSMVILYMGYDNLTKDADIVGYILACSGVPLFLGFFLYFIYNVKKLFTFRTLIIVDEKGITDHCSSYQFGFIPWENIKNINLSSQRLELGIAGRIQFNPGFPAIQIDLIDNETVLNNYKGFKQNALKARVQNMQPIIYIPRKTLNIIDEQELFELMKYYFVQ